MIFYYTKTILKRMNSVRGKPQNFNKAKVKPELISHEPTWLIPGEVP